VSGTGDVWLTTSRLVLRRPRADDLEDYVRLHTDPHTYRHKPASMPSPARCRERLAHDLAGWEQEGIGYVAVLARDSGRVIGWAGLRVERDYGPPHLNLYFRLGAESHGLGYGRELARALVGWAAEHRPDLPVTAMVAPVNAASLATCRAAGLFEIGRRTHPLYPDDEPDVLLELPSLHAVPHVDAELREELLDLWVAVNASGGAVGFVGSAPRDEVAARLDTHLAAVRDDESLLGVMRDPAGVLRGVGFWEHVDRLPLSRTATLKRFMVDPLVQGRNLGRVLLGGLVALVRAERPSVATLQLDYRSGTGVGSFYESCGWVEVGRIPRSLWLGGDDYRDDVVMARRVDAGPLVLDGRR
jgi:RimJ/RimL family protein N-acetyltransferase/ribosomal protein S18 acetylase RimI-like enzyme